MSNGRHFTPPTPAFRPVDPFAPMVPRSAERVPSCETTQPLPSRVRPVRVDNSAPSGGGKGASPAPATPTAASGSTPTTAATSDGKKVAAKSAAPSAPATPAPVADARPRRDTPAPAGKPAVKEAAPAAAAPPPVSDAAKGKKVAEATPAPAPAKASKIAVEPETGAKTKKPAPAPEPVAAKGKKEAERAPAPVAAKAVTKLPEKAAEKAPEKTAGKSKPAEKTEVSKSKAAAEEAAPKGGKKVTGKDKPARPDKASAAPSEKTSKSAKAAPAVVPSKAVKKAVAKGKVTKLAAPTLAKKGAAAPLATNIGKKALPAPKSSAAEKGGKSKRGRGGLTPPPGMRLGPGEELRICEWERCQKTFVVKPGGRNTVRRFCSGTCRGRASEARTGKR